MFELDAFHLARIQFAFTVSFHILFPAITIGLASYLVVLEGMWLRTKNDVWRSLYHFWGFVNGMVASHLLCHSGTINRHSLNGALLS